MLRGNVLAWLTLALAACGGGGGGGEPTVQPAAPLRLAVDDAEIGAGTDQGEILVRLVSIVDGRTGLAEAERQQPLVPSVAPTLLEVAVELPSALALPASDRLVPATAVANLDGDFVGSLFVVLCGDAQNDNAAALQPGALFRLRVQPALPRQPGTYTVRFVDLRGASRDGLGNVQADAGPFTATVVVR